jgi:hypothetical protein
LIPFFQSFSAEDVSACAAVVTALLALLIYFEAKRLQKVDGLSRSIGNWQDFNRLMMQKDLADRWQAIHTGQVPWAEITQQDKALIYSYLNIMVYEYQAAHSGALDKLYAQKSVGDNILYFQYIWPELLEHLKTDGWPEGFVEAADCVVKAKGAMKPNLVTDPW